MIIENRKYYKFKKQANDACFLNPKLMFLLLPPILLALEWYILVP
jgi:hypothetical protein